VLPLIPGRIPAEGQEGGIDVDLRFPAAVPVHRESVIKVDAAQGRSKASLCLVREIAKQMANEKGLAIMEGNGPLQGTARDLGRVVMSDDPVAADFTCARLMGFDPYRISHLAQAAEFLGNGDVQRIEQLGKKLPRTVRPFSVLPEFAHLIAGATS
jgi:hypothetical protein